MADEQSPLDMDQIANTDDDAVLQAEIEKRRLAQQAPSEEEAPKPAEPPPEEKPEQPTPSPAPEPVTPTTEPKVESKATEPRPRDDAAWKRVRLLERQVAELTKQREQQTQDTPKPPAFEDDPANNLDTRTRQLEQAYQQLRGEQSQFQRQQMFQRQEMEFTARQPDYTSAVEYLRQSEIASFDALGGTQAEVNRVRGLMQAENAGDQRYRGVVAHVERVAGMPQVLEEAARQNADPEDVALQFIARDNYIANRVAAVQQFAEATGKNWAEGLYQEAQRRGYKTASAPAQTQAPPAQAEADINAARERVLRQKEISAASNSLSETASGEAGPAQRVLKNRAQILDLDERSLDALIESRQFKEL